MDELSYQNADNLSATDFLRSKHIVCCDDDDNILKYIKAVFDHYCKITVFDRGSKIKEFCLANPVDAVILDVHMPPPNGYAVLTILKEDKKTRHIPVIMFTSETRKEEIKKIISSGANGYLIKPSPPKVVRGRVIEALLKANPESALNIIRDDDAGLSPHPAVPQHIGENMAGEFDMMLSAIKNIQVGFSGSETMEWGYKNILEGILNISKLSTGGIFFRDEYDGTYKLAGMKNPVMADVLKKSFERNSDKIKNEFELQKKAFYSFFELNANWVAMALSVSDEMLGIVILQVPDKKWEQALREDKALESFMTLSKFIIDNYLKKKKYDYNLINLAKAFSASLDAKDPYSQNHSERVSLYSLAIDVIAEKQNSDYYIKREPLQLAGLLHDIGKIGIPDNILLKQDKLSDDEMAVMKTHVTMGQKMLDNVPLLKIAMEGLAHHEKFDGTGYPDRLAGETIPLAGRIIAVADYFDALTTDRPYRKALPATVALEEIKKLSGSHFDPVVCGLFAEAFAQGLVDTIVGIQSAGSVHEGSDIKDKKEKKARKSREHEFLGVEKPLARKIVSHLDEINFGSPATAEMISKLSRPRVSITDVAKHIASNTVLTAKILKVANSAFYGFTRRIHSVEQAIVLLGFNAIKHIIYLNDMLGIYRDIGFSKKFVADLSRHSMITGLISRYLAKKVNKPKFCEDAFLLGVMHDIGKIGLLKIFPERYEKVLETVTKKNVTFSEAEYEEFELTHSQITVALCDKWKFPDFMADVYLHLHVEKYVSDDKLSLNNILKCADDLSYRTSMPCVPDYPVLAVEHPAFEALGIKGDNIETLLAEIETLLADNMEFIEL